MTTADAPDFFRLDGRCTTLILEDVPGRSPLWRHWGPRLPGRTRPEGVLQGSRPLPTFSLDSDVAFSVFPLLGEGWFAQSALLAHREGRSWAQAITASQIQLDGNALAITLSDVPSGIEVRLGFALDPDTDILTASARLTNTGEGVLDVAWLAAATLPLPPAARRLRYWSGRHQAEFQPQDEALGRGLFRRENRRGLTSHVTPPTGFAETDEGCVYGAHFAWSGNSVQQVEWLDDGRFLWQWGEWLAPGEVRLGAGESLETPELLATFSPDGLNGVMQNFHAAMRKRISWPGGLMRPRPVQINTWEGFYFNHDVGGMKALATTAASLGIERFVLDDGWFLGRDNDRAALGDWTPDPRKYPDGLKPLADHVTGLGMEFGLWVEPEMISPDSNLARRHPDWILEGASRRGLTGRNQMVLDYTHPGVTDYLFEAIAALLRTLPISYLKWDHNRDLVAGGEQPTYRRQVLAAYGLMARLREAFRDVEIESCAGGGGRTDAGILRHTHRFWTSDSLDAVQRIHMQREFLRVFPPEVMGAHVGTAPAHSTRRTQSLDFRAGVALSGHFGVELDPAKLPPRERDKLAAWIADYKQLRGRLHGGRLWIGDAGDGVLWQAHGSDESLLLLVYRVAPSTQRHMPHLRLPMLDMGQRYIVSWIDRTRTPQTAPLLEQMRQGLAIDGAWLAQSGLVLPAAHTESLLIFDIQADA